MQAADEADPVEKEPKGQSPLIKPEAAQYLPAGQDVHEADEVAPLEENDPGEHTPLTAMRPVLLQYAPGSQSKHELLPVWFWKYPEAQGVHAEDEAKPTEYEPATHFPVSMVSPVVAQYMPGLQDKHDACPVRG